MSRITIVSLGPGDPDWLNQKTVQTLKHAKHLYLRTDHHEIKAWLEKNDISYHSFDSLYEEADSFDSLNHQIAKELWKAAEKENLVYAVTDALSDGSVDTLIADRPSEKDLIDIVPGISTADFILSHSRNQIAEGQIRTSTASSLADYEYDPEISLLITELNDEITAGSVKEYLGQYLDDEDRVLYFSNYDAKPKSIPLFELDRQKKMDHLSGILIPGRNMMDRERYTLHDLEKIMDRLRDPQHGCPWDRKQTPESLKPYIIEEAWETIGAIDDKDPDELASELGDLLFQIIFQSSIGKSKGDFDIRDVVSRICQKMIRRHPHVFAGETWQNESAQAEKWEEIKRAETGRTSVAESLNDVSSSLPGLRYAQKMIKKSQPLRKEEDSVSSLLSCMSGILAEAEENGQEMTEDAMENLLFLCARICHLCGFDGEILLHQAADRFKKRFTS